MARVNHRQYQKFVEFVYGLLEYNKECRFCDQGGKSEETQNANPRTLFEVKFRFDYRHWTGLDLFRRSVFRNDYEKQMYILRICRNCGHIEKFDFERFVGKSYKNMMKEIRTW